MLQTIQNIIDNRTKASIFLVFFAVILYLPTVTYDYNIDDELVTRGHRFTSQGLSAVKDIFTNNYFDDGAGNAYEYRPLVHLSFAIEHQFFGESASVSHFINVLLYGLTAFLLYGFLLNFLGSKYQLLSAFVTLLFIVHPVHTEAVTSIKNRDEILAFIFILLSLKFVLKYASEKGAKYFIPIVLFFLLGLLSKKSVVHFALIIPVLLVFYEKSISSIRYYGLGLSLIIIALFFADISSYTQLATFFTISILSITVIKALKTQNDFSFIKKAIDKIKSIMSNPFGDFDRAEIENAQLSKRDFIFQGVSLIFLLPLFYYTYTIDNFLLFFISLASYLILCVSLRKEVNIYSTFAIFTILLNVATVVFKLGGLVSITFSLTLSIWYVVYRKKTLLFFIPSVLIALFCVLVPNEFELHYLPGFFVFIIPLFFLSKYRKYYLMGVIVLYAISIISNFQNYVESNKTWSENYEELITFYSNLIFICFIWIKEKKQNLFFSSIFVFNVFIISFFVINNIQHEKNKKIDSVVEKTIEFEKVEGEKEKNLTQKTILGNELLSRGRKLNFVEYPIKDKANFGTKLALSADVLLEYLKVFIIPYPLSSYYGYSYFKEISLANVYVIVSLIVHITILILSLLNFHQRPLVFIGGFVYLTSVIVFSNLLVPVPGMMGIRLAYIAVLGFILFILGFVKWENKKLKSFGNNIFLGLLSLLLLSGFTLERNRNWKNNLNLLEVDTKRFPESAQLNNMLGTNYLKEAGKSRGVEYTQKLQNAIIYLEKAIAIYPDFFNANFDIGRTSILLGDYNKAIKAFEKATEIKPKFVEAHFQKGLAYEKIGKNELAIDSYLEGIKQDSSHMKSFNNISAIYFREKKFADAVKINLKSVENNPSTFEAVDNLAKSYYYNNEKLLAAQYFEKALQLKFSMDLLLTVANVYKEAGDLNKANHYFSEYNKRIK